MKKSYQLNRCPGASLLEVTQKQEAHAGGSAAVGRLGGPEPMGFIGRGFRNWVQGIEAKDNQHFDRCLQLFVDGFGIKSGIVLSTQLGYWVDALDHCKARPFDIYEPDAAGFSHDEVMAISLVAASQHADCPALKACLYAITQSSDTHYAQQATQVFADGLIDAGLVIRPEAIMQPLAAMQHDQAHLTN